MLYLLALTSHQVFPIRLTTTHSFSQSFPSLTALCSFPERGNVLQPSAQSCCHAGEWQTHSTAEAVGNVLGSWQSALERTETFVLFFSMGVWGGRGGGRGETYMCSKF